MPIPNDHSKSSPHALHGCDVVVVGAGLAGLSAAAFAARGGARVLLLDRTEFVGGRASTQQVAGYDFNIGPHALYAGGPAAKVLAELGVGYTGRRPPAAGGLACRRGRLHALPGGLVSLLTTDLLQLSGKFELARVLGSLPRLEAASLRGLSVRDWLDATFRDEIVRALVEALLRLTSYANDPERSCAAAALAQLQAGLGHGVLYLDGGWGTLVAGLEQAATRAGVEVRTSARVRSVRASADGVEIHFADGDAAPVRARCGILALPPSVAAALVGTESDGASAVAAWAREAVPVRAACLDLGLRRLPNPRRLFALGIDRPTYFSVHSASARLAPEGGALVHVAMYLGSDRPDAKAVEAELESFADLVQPGWREVMVERRYLPSMLVAGSLVSRGAPSPGPAVPGTTSLLVAGDWVGEEGMLADRALASGRLAGRTAARTVAAGSSPTIDRSLAAA